ncbi:MAG: hypothetical protein CMJ64_04555 [Planctomycetaceae bacterium]|nr:hypothetical protein [Planctomycetaceae bacterium]
MQLNVDASRGSVRVELLDAAGTPMPAFSGSDTNFRRDINELRLRPTWKAHTDLSTLQGQIVRLKISLQNASLYAFQIQP